MLVERWRQTSNRIRPHRALGYLTLSSGGCRTTLRLTHMQAGTFTGGWSLAKEF